MTKQNYLSKVFLWMAIGLFVTFITGAFISGNANALDSIFSNFWIFIILEIGLAIFLSARVQKMSGTTAKLLFLVYSFVSGLTFSSIFVVYKLGSIIAIFLATSICMLIFSVIGARTKIDLSKLGTYLMMALIAIVILMIINIFVGSESLDMGIAAVSIFIFFGFIAYDIQRISTVYAESPDSESLAIYGAFQLYLDFINIFIDLLRLFAKQNN